MFGEILIAHFGRTILLQRQRRKTKDLYKEGEIVLALSYWQTLIRGIDWPESYLILILDARSNFNGVHL